jgi:hypothetical protein
MNSGDLFIRHRDAWFMFRDVEADGNCMYYCLAKCPATPLTSTDEIRKALVKLMSSPSDHLKNFFIEYHKTDENPEPSLQKWKESVSTDTEWGSNFESSLFGAIYGVDVRIITNRPRGFEESDTRTLLEMYQVDSKKMIPKDAPVYYLYLHKHGHPLEPTIKPNHFAILDPVNYEPPEGSIIYDRSKERVDAKKSDTSLEKSKENEPDRKPSKEFQETKRAARRPSFVASESQPKTTDTIRRRYSADLNNFNSVLSEKGKDGNETKEFNMDRRDSCKEAKTNEMPTEDTSYSSLDVLASSEDKHYFQPRVKGVTIPNEKHQHDNLNNSWDSKEERYGSDPRRNQYRRASTIDAKRQERKQSTTEPAIVKHAVEDPHYIRKDSDSNPEIRSKLSDSTKLSNGKLPQGSKKQEKAYDDTAIHIQVTRSQTAGEMSNSRRSRPESSFENQKQNSYLKEGERNPDGMLQQDMQQDRRESEQQKQSTRFSQPPAERRATRQRIEAPVQDLDRDSISEKKLEQQRHHISRLDSNPQSKNGQIASRDPQNLRRTDVALKLEANSDSKRRPSFMVANEDSKARSRVRHPHPDLLDAIPDTKHPSHPNKGADHDPASVVSSSADTSARSKGNTNSRSSDGIKSSSSFYEESMYKTEFSLPSSQKKENEIISRATKAEKYDRVQSSKDNEVKPQSMVLESKMRRRDDIYSTATSQAPHVNSELQTMNYPISKGSFQNPPNQSNTPGNLIARTQDGHRKYSEEERGLRKSFTCEIKEKQSKPRQRLSLSLPNDEANDRTKTQLTESSNKQRFLNHETGSSNQSGSRKRDSPRRSSLTIKDSLPNETEQSSSKDIHGRGFTSSSSVPSHRISPNRRTSEVDVKSMNRGAPSSHEFIVNEGCAIRRKSIASTASSSRNSPVNQRLPAGEAQKGSSSNQARIESRTPKHLERPREEAQRKERTPTRFSMTESGPTKQQGIGHDHSANRMPTRKVDNSIGDEAVPRTTAVRRRSLTSKPVVNNPKPRMVSEGMEEDTLLKHTSTNPKKKSTGGSITPDPPHRTSRMAGNERENTDNRGAERRVSTSAMEKESKSESGRSHRSTAQGRLHHERFEVDGGTHLRISPNRSRKPREGELTPPSLSVDSQPTLQQVSTASWAADIEQRVKLSKVSDPIKRKELGNDRPAIRRGTQYTK